MEFGQIEAFLAVVSEGSFTRAAAQLNLTQPSLSTRIHQLEQSLGGELFQRDKRPVQLTDLGNVFFNYAERAIGILEAGREAVRATQIGMVGRVNVCSPFSLANSLLPEVVNRFGQMYPQAELSLETGHSDFCISQLSDGLANLAFAAAFPRFASKTQAVLELHDKMVVAVNEHHDLLAETAVSISQLWQYQVLIIHWGSAFDGYIESLREADEAQGAVVRVPLAAALPMARQPHTVTFLPRRLAAVSGLLELNVPDFSFDWNAILATRPGYTPTPVEQRFIEIVNTVWQESSPA
ncbi:MAG: LysR family transcriptional regulator [Anaerolineales bacterium]|nr:LysR family transcriptional regulator [Anaerolineales bacterium]